MGLEDLVDCIELLQRRIRDYAATLQEDETRTRMALIEPLLKALGWDPADPGLVTPEYKVGDGKADYALLRIKEPPAAVIEAKRLGTVLNDRIRQQMLTYATFYGIKYAGVTDGNHWELYTVFEPGLLLEERQILKISIAGDPIHESALKLLLLWRVNLESGEPVLPNKPIIIAPPSVKPDPPVAPAPSGHNWVPLSKYEPPLKTPCPAAIWFWDGSERPLKRWNQVLASVVEKLHAEGRFTAKHRTIGWSKKTYCVHTEPVHPTGKKFGNPKSIAGGSLFVECGLNASAIRQNARRLLEHFRQNPANVYLQPAQ